MRLLIFLLLNLFFSNAFCVDYKNDHIVLYQNSACIIPHFGYHYETCHPIKVTIDHFTLVIPKGFDTDLASIPRLLWTFIAPTRSDFIAPAILHDYLYTCHQGFRRRTIDKIFLTALIENKVNKITAYEMYWAVRWFGKKHFNNDDFCSWTDIKIDKLQKDFKTFSEDE